MAITKQQYLSDLQGKVDKAMRAKSAKAKRRKGIVAGILVIGTLAGLVLGHKITTGEKEKAYSTYVSAISGTEKARVPYEYLDYKDLFDLWNGNDIGNDINALLSGGKLLFRGGICVFPASDGSGTKVVFSSGEEKSLDAEASYINFIDNCIIYRNDTDRKVYSFNLGTGEQHLLYGGNVGEVLITNNMIYCVDFSRNSAIVSMNLEGQEMQIIVSEPVISFAVCGDTVLYLDTSQNLLNAGIDGASSTTIASNIERFFVDGRVYAESDNTIFSFTPLGIDSNLVYQADDAFLRLVGVSDGAVFYQEEGELNCVNSGIQSTLLSEQHTMYSSLIKSGANTVSVLAYDTADGSVLKHAVLEVPVAEMAGGD